MSPPQLIPPTSPGQVIAGDVRLRRRFSRHRTWSVPDADRLQPQRGRDLVAATQCFHMCLIYVGYGIKDLLEYVCWKFDTFDVSTD